MRFTTISKSFLTFSLSSSFSWSKQSHSKVAVSKLLNQTKKAFNQVTGKHPKPDIRPYRTFFAFNCLNCDNKCLAESRLFNFVFDDSCQTTTKNTVQFSFDCLIVILNENIQLKL